MLAAFAFVVLSGGPASAHSSLVAADPAPGYTVGAVDRVVLRFNEAVSAAPTAVGLAGAAGSVPVRVTVESSGTVLVGRPVEPLTPGAYTVSWTVTADDGDVVEGSFPFGVQGAAGSTAAVPSAAAAAAGDGTTTRGAVSVTLLRWLLFAALSVALGGAVGTVLLRRIQRQARTVPAVPDAPVLSASAAGAFVAALLAVHALGNGDLVAGLGALSPARIAEAGPARVPVAEVALFVVAAVLTRVRRGNALAVSVPLIGVAVAEGLRSHLDSRLGALGAAVIGAHLVAAAVWVGALLAVLRGAVRWRSAGRTVAAWFAVHDYARLAVWLYVVVAATGTVAAVALVGSWGALTGSGYGQRLLLKLGVFTVVTLLAVWSRRRLGQGPGPRRTPGRPALVESGTLLLVLAVTASLVSTRTPADAVAVTALPPPAPVGPVLQLGTLAGQLTVGVAVSDGQLRVSVASPATDDGDLTPFRVKAAVAAGAGPEQAVPLAPCGHGCFAAPVAWSGSTRLVVDVRSEGWEGGRATFDVPWPLPPAGPALARAYALLRATKQFTLTERVSSNSNGAFAKPVDLTLSGVEFLAAEPDGSVPTTAVLLPDPDRRLRFAFPSGDRSYVDLLLDRQGRVAEQTLTTPNHIIERTFAYPSDGGGSG